VSKRPRPIVLMIDDDPDKIKARATALEEHVDVILRHFEDVRRSDVRAADMVLVDYRIDDWLERDNLKQVARRPADGLAVAAVIRSYANRISRRPRAFAIHSGQLNALSGGLPVLSREHAIARTLNLEWVFAKNELGSSQSFFDQVPTLAEGMSRLPIRWPEDPSNGTKLAHKLLGLPARSSWKERAKADVESCRLPAHASAISTNGMSFVRWLLHRILPYPCFLWDVHYLAARMRVSPLTLKEAIEVDPKISRALQSVRYRGVFAGFIGDRWWRSGVESLIWSWTDGNPFDGPALAEAVREHLSASIELISTRRPVVTVDPSYRPSDRLIDVELAVEIQPDDWPSYAEQAWVSREDALSDAELRAQVVQGDRRALE
jgi:hypothetical protein